MVALLWSSLPNVRLVATETGRSERVEGLRQGPLVCPCPCDELFEEARDGVEYLEVDLSLRVAKVGRDTVRLRTLRAVTVSVLLRRF